jgi:hypothetical protein
MLCRASSPSRCQDGRSAVAPYLNAASPDDLGPTDRIAYDIIADPPDLLTSVQRIMTADLDSDAAHRAIRRWRDQCFPWGTSRGWRRGRQEMAVT